MAHQNQLNGVRGKALDRIDRSARNYKLAFVAAAAIEGLFLLAFLLLADFSNRIHLLLFVAAMAVYLILGSGLFALGAHISRNTQIILKAIELLDSNPDH